MTKTIEVARLVALGGREWKSADGQKHRVYFDAKTANAFAGIKKLPNFGFEFAGEKISEYRRNEISLNDFHYDVEAGEFRCSGKWVQETLNAAVSEIKRQLAAEPTVEQAAEMDSAAQVAALQDEQRALHEEVTKLQADAQKLSGGENDPAYPAMAARYEEIEARKAVVLSELHALGGKSTLARSY